MNISSDRAWLVCGTALAALAFSTIAHAQEAPPAAPPEVSSGPAAAEPAETSEILVTGSRIKKNGFDSPMPVTVVDETLVKNLGQNNAQEVIRLIPQNIATNSDATSGNRLSADIGAAYANLRGLNPTFGTRTLTLVNSRRFVPTSDGGQVDLNLIPSIMIQRVETVTGGASAAYGSDAVAGVVNVILDTKLKGFKSVIDYGQTGRGDGKSLHGAAAYGLNFAEDRGHVMIGGEYQRNRGISHCAEVREWCATSYGIFVNEADIQPGTINSAANISGYNVPGSFGFGSPNYIIGPNAGQIYNSPFGTIRNYTTAAATSTTSFSNNYPAINPPLSAVNKVFTPNGSAVVDYQPGDFGPKAVSGQARGGDNPSAYSDQRIQTPTKRYTAYLSADYEVSSALKLTTELTYGRRQSSSTSPAAATRSTMPIKPDNAFLPAAVVATLGGQNFSLGKDVDNELDNRNRVDAKVFRGVAGLSGKLFGDFTWDAYYQYGHNKRHSSVRYSRQNDAFVMAIDAVRNASGQIICRPLSPTLLATFSAAYAQELRDLYASCAPLNLFGSGSMSKQAIDFAWREVVEDFKYRQHVASGSVQGTVWDGWGAGPIGVAAGIDYRNEKGNVTHGGINPNAFAFSFGLDYAGAIEVTEGFGEANVPIFRDWWLGNSFEVNGAVRYTRNKSTDTLTNQSKTIKAVSWKVGGIYDVIDGVRFRATRSRDIRAAGFRELFQKTAPSDEGTVQGRVNNPAIAGANKNDNVPIFTGGNFGLTPEKADTTTVGAVLTPRFLRGFQLSLDWYQIKLKDAISILNGQRVTDLCITYNVLCDRVGFGTPLAGQGANTNINRIDAGQANVGKIVIRGFDFEASYRLPLANLKSSMKGNITTRFLLTHQYDFTVQQNVIVPGINYAGQSGPVLEGGDFNPTPKWMWNALIGYDTSRFNTTVSIRYVGKGIYNAEWIGPEDAGYSPALKNSINTNRVKSATYFNIAMSYFIPFGAGERRGVEVFGTVENIFDKKPPVAPGGAGSLLTSAYPTNPVYFDTFGARGRVGMRLTF